MKKPSSLLGKAYALLAGDTSVGKSKKRPFKRYTERELITLESEIGAELFGPVEKGRHREFFCLDEKTWIWHEGAISRPIPSATRLMTKASSKHKRVLATAT